MGSTAKWRFNRGEISKPKDTSVEMIQSEQKRQRKKMNKYQWDNNKISNAHVPGVSEGKSAVHKKYLQK